MRTAPYHPFSARVRSIGAALLTGMMATAALGSEPDGTEQFDCGTIALHTLLSLEGQAASLDAIREHLPRLHPRGYSLAELRDASRACGLALTGVKLPRSDHAPDRVALVFMQREEHGHFLVVRPVGHSGKLVQVIDSTGDPVVMDAVNLYAASQWTGLALVPVRPNWPLRVAIGSMLVSSFIVVLLLAANRSRAARGRRT